MRGMLALHASSQVGGENMMRGLPVEFGLAFPRQDSCEGLGSELIGLASP